MHAVVAGQLWTRGAVLEKRNILLSRWSWRRELAPAARPQRCAFPRAGPSYCCMCSSSVTGWTRSGWSFAWRLLKLRREVIHWIREPAGRWKGGGQFVLPEQKESIKLRVCGSSASSITGLVSLDLAFDVRSPFITRKYMYIPGFRSVVSWFLKIATDFMGLPSFVLFFFTRVCVHYGQPSSQPLCFQMSHKGPCWVNSLNECYSRVCVG